jgi:salicylate hydroxylase
LQFLLAFSVALGRYINFLGYTLQPYLVAMAYETDARNPQTPFEGKASNEWVSELTAGQLVEPFKNFEEDARSILEVCHTAARIAVTIHY